MLLDLPDEVLVLVAENIGYQRDIYHLAITSRRLCNVSLPVLYSDVTLGKYWRNDRRQIPSFFYSIVRHPQLARAVRSLHLKSWKNLTDYYDPALGILHVDPPHERTFTCDADIIGPMLINTNMTDRERAQWASGIKHGIDDAWLALIVPRLTQIRRIKIIWPWADRYSERNPVGWFLEMLERAALEETPVFPHLEEAQMSWRDQDITISSHAILPFFKFPSMRKLMGCRFECISVESNPDILNVPMSGITEITLCCPGDTDAGFRSLIAPCKALKVFKVEQSENPQPIVQSLLLQKATLESIHIRSPQSDELEESQHKIESFAKFTALKHLHIGMENLIEIATPEDLRGALPSSLETLHLHCPDEELLHKTVWQLEKLVAWKSLPKLASLAIEAQRPRIPGDTLRAELKELISRCQEAGISLYAIEEQRPNLYTIQLVSDPDRPGDFEPNLPAWFGFHTCLKELEIIQTTPRRLLPRWSFLPQQIAQI